MNQFDRNRFDLRITNQKKLLYRKQRYDMYCQLVATIIPVGITFIRAQTFPTVHRAIFDRISRAWFAETRSKTKQILSRTRNDPRSRG